MNELRFFWSYACSLLHDRYCTAYWRQVAQNEQWLLLLTELTKKKD